MNRLDHFTFEGITGTIDSWVRQARSTREYFVRYGSIGCQSDAIKASSPLGQFLRERGIPVGQ
jgi:hypothetical protein